MLAGEKRKVGGSIGIASYPADAGSIEQLIICADDAMYQVKKSGRNNFAFYKTDGNETQENENGGSLCTK
jgi:diguanylate cyclase (GGDEF)-like protein